MPAWLAVSAFVGAYACGAKDGNDGSEEGNPPPFCADLDDMATCELRVGCLWEADGGTCEYECLGFGDAQTCDAQESCEWIDDTCEHSSL